MEEFDQERFNEFIAENNVCGFFKDAITLVSGRKSHFYVNWRNVVEDAWLTDKLSDFLIAFIRSKGIEVDTFYGVPDGATKIGVITQFKSAKMSEDFGKGSHTLAMGRKTPKEHGAPKDRFFVGMPRGKTVVIEDVTTTGGSLVKNLKSLKEAGVDISAVISLTNRMEKRDDGKSVKEAVNELGLDFYNMSSSLELLPLLYKTLAPGDDVAKAVTEEFDEYGVEKIDLM